ncbi:MAG: ATP-binding protein [Actinomycetota bacterium]|nr:ATP-binding protein [Actinomycetota bacterium]
MPLQIPESGSAHRFRLEVPAEATFVGPARLFAAAIAREMHLEEGLVEDLKLAVSEACAYLLTPPSPDARLLLLEVTQLDDRLEFSVSESTAPGASTAHLGFAALGPADVGKEAEGPSLGLEVIGALFHDARLSPSDVRRITFSVGVEEGATE